jgi:hypothetical protein
MTGYHEPSRTAAATLAIACGSQPEGPPEAALPLDVAIPVAYGPKKLITRVNTSARCAAVPYASRGKARKTTL